MSKRQKSRSRRQPRQQAGHFAQAGGHTLRSFSVGILPVLNRLLERMQLERFLTEHLPADDPRTKVPTVRVLLALIRNLLVSREPMYALGEWARRYPPDLFGFSPGQLRDLNDDCAGRGLDRLFACNQPELVMDVVRHVVREFDLGLEEFHNDSTTVSFFGAYEDAAEEGIRDGRETPAVTYGHSKARRPDLKQLLYILTVTDDGGVPIYFGTRSGNVVDDRTHRETWDLLHELLGGPDFLYVADCKLATTENMKYIHRRQGRFISMLPASRREDRRFRKRLAEDPDSMAWKPLYSIRDDQGEIVDRFSVCGEEAVTADHFRLWWYHSIRKQERDDRARMDRIRRSIERLKQLRQRLLGPRSRLKRPADVRPEVDRILTETQAEPWLRVEIHEREKETFRQARPGRPGPDTEYIRQVKRSCDLTWELDTDAIQQAQKTDGVFPLITNQKDADAEEVLKAYKRQPLIEKRFSQFKTQYRIAPVFLKQVSRIQALLCAYFFALMLQTLLERELREGMKSHGVESLPLYPEQRPCKLPSTRRVIDVFEPIQRHRSTVEGRSHILTTELSPLQRQILDLMHIDHQNYGR